MSFRPTGGISPPPAISPERPFAALGYAPLCEQGDIATYARESRLLRSPGSPDLFIDIWLSERLQFIYGRFAGVIATNGKRDQRTKSDDPRSFS
jgi:hypothetical protein